MRNICISYDRLKFFTKRLNADEVLELKSVMVANEEGFFIAWVADSILKYNKFRQSRSENRKGKNKEKQNITSPTYDNHMESESDNNTVLKNINKGKGKVVPLDFEGTETVLTFDQFWELYDKKIGRKACEKKYKAVSEPDRVKIADHLPKYKTAQPDKQFRKDPETFLNNASWNDEIITRNATIIKPPPGPDNGKMGTSAARVDALSKW